MARCLELAGEGLGFVAPNPMVGAAVWVDGRIVGEGYHEKFGGPHAEVNAIRQVKETSLLARATLFVCLEPCCHHGKTPPCTDLIIQSGIPRVVVACSDPFPQVAGKGVDILRQNGVEVECGMLEAQARKLNRRFFTFHQRKRPFVILKWAQTADGFLARQDLSSKWISSEPARRLTHLWRGQESAVMVGSTTALVDNPQLTVRDLPAGSKAYSNPLRVALDRNQSLPRNHSLLDGSAPSLIFTESRDPQAKAKETLIAIDFSSSVLQQVLSELYKRNIQSLLVEGGAGLLSSFIDSNLWDEGRVFVAPTKFNAGIAAPKMPLSPVDRQMIDCDQLLLFENPNPA